MANMTICQGPPRVSDRPRSKHITRTTHDFYLGSTPKACGDIAFSYRIMGGHVGDTWEFVKGPYHQGYIYDSNGNVAIGVLPRDPILGQTMTWDMENMLDVQNFQRYEERQKVINQEVVFKTKIFMSSWTSGHTSTALWTFGIETIALICKRCSAIPNCQGLPLGTTFALVHKRLGRCKLRSCGPSTKVGTQGETPNPLSTKIERCELESWHSLTFGYWLRTLWAFWTHITKTCLILWCYIFDSNIHNV